MIQNIILLILLFFVAGSFLFAYVLLYNERKRKHIAEKKEMQRLFDLQLLQSQFEVQERTYADLSRELHDNVGQLLNSTKLLIGVAQREMQNPPPLLETANEILSNAINEIRTLSKSLDPEWLEQFRLLENIEQELKRINSTGYIKASLQTSLTNIELGSDRQLILFRIIQEALQNVIKHSQASVVTIRIGTNKQLLEVTVTDNGTGFNPANTSSQGIGITHMYTRSQILGGQISIGPASFGKGSVVHLSIPLSHDTTIQG